MAKAWSQKGNLWRIKSPWLRLPVAWIYVTLAAAVFGLLFVAAIVVGACAGAKEGFDDYKSELRGLGKDMWRAATTVRIA